MFSVTFATMYASCIRLTDVDLVGESELAVPMAASAAFVAMTLKQARTSATTAAKADPTGRTVFMDILADLLDPSSTVCCRASHMHLMYQRLSCSQRSLSWSSYFFACIPPPPPPATSSRHILPPHHTLNITRSTPHTQHHTLSITPSTSHP